MRESTEPPQPPPRLDYEIIGPLQSASLVGVCAAWGSVLASAAQLLLICGSPRMLFFHATDAATAVGTFTRFDRLCFIMPALLAIGLGLLAMRMRGTQAGGIVGITLAFLSLLLISKMGFSK